MHSIEHPFLLSDNRHYSFYLWRRIYKLHPAVKYLLAPIYVLLAFHAGLALGMSWLTSVLGCCR